MVLLKDLKKHANVFQQGGYPCLSSFKMIHLENDGHASFSEFQSYIALKKLRCEWLSGSKLSALKESKNTRHTSPALQCRSEGSNSVWARPAWSRCSSSSLWCFLHSWCRATCWDEEAQQGFGLRVRGATPWELQPCQDTLELQLCKGQAHCHARQHSINLRWVFVMEITITQSWLTHWPFSLLSEIKKTTGSLSPPGSSAHFPKALTHHWHLAVAETSQ